MKFEPTLKVTFYDVMVEGDGPSFSAKGAVQQHSQLWLGGRLIASYNARHSTWVVHEGTHNRTAWPSFKMEVIP